MTAAALQIAKLLACAAIPPSFFRSWSETMVPDVCDSSVRVPNLTPFPQLLEAATCAEFNGSDSTAYLSIAGFNLLAELYVRPYDFRTGGIQPFAAFEWISEGDTPNVLNIENRGPRLLEAMRSCRADCICLQELQLERQGSDDANKGPFVLPQWMRPIVDEDDFDIVLPPQSELDVIGERNIRVLGKDAAVTCAVLYRKDRLEIVEERFKSPKDVDTNTQVTVCLKGKDDSPLAAIDQGIVVTSIHLDATDERKRVGQLRSCLHRARNFRTNEDEFEPISTLIVGDYNQEFHPGSCVSAFLVDSKPEPFVRDADMSRECAASRRLEASQKPTAKQLKEWRELYEDTYEITRDMCVSLKRVPTCDTRSAYDHDVASDCDGKPAMMQWRLDHLLYTSETLEPVRHWATLESDMESCTIGLPNHKYGSDHLPIGALFRVNATSTLSEREKSELITIAKNMADRQKIELCEREKELDEELAQIEASLPPPAKEENSKKKKKGKGPPPKEIMEFMRKRRSIIKEIKASHRKERELWINSLGALAKLAIVNHLGYSPCQFIERGAS